MKTPFRYQFCPSFTDDPVLLATFCGRAEEIARIVHGTSDGKNFLLEGETRIGKTFLITFLEDLTNGDVKSYANHLIDSEVKKQIKILSPQLKRLTFLNISLHGLNDANVLLNTALEKMLRAVGRQSPYGFSHTVSTVSFLSVIEQLVSPSLDSRRVVLVFDEFEKITTSGYTGKKTDLLGCFSQLTHSFPKIRLIVCGWNGMEERMRKSRLGKISDFFDQIDRRIYLGPIPERSARKLITKVGSSVFNDAIPSKTISRSLSFTGRRPFYIQRYYDIISEMVNITKSKTLSEFSNVSCCEESVEKKLSEDTRFTIHEAISGNEERKRLLYALASKAGCTMSFLEAVLGKESIARELEDLEMFQFITSLSGNYSVHAELYRLWILRNIRNPFVDDRKTPPNIANVGVFVAFVEELLVQFKHQIEQKKGYKLLWHDGKTPEPEEHSQVLFDLLFEKYAGKHGVFLIREAETGRGPVDFKFTGGFDWTAHMEIKRADSPKLRHGLRKQLPTYLNADDVGVGFYCIVAYNQSHLVKCEKLARESAGLEKELNLVLRVHVVDARPKRSASK